MLSESVKNIRNSKLPDPKLQPNVGSIFKNPIVRTNHFDQTFLDGHSGIKTVNIPSLAQPDL